jgi:hypothetical protein
MESGSRAGGARLAAGLAIMLVIGAGLMAVPAIAQTATTATLQSPATPAAPKPAEDAADGGGWWQPHYLAFYKTLSYTAVVLTTDQLWYMALAAQAATSSGLFGVANMVTSPMLTYGFEYGWQLCCEAPPGPDGVRPVDVRKALMYRVLSASRTMGLALLFGNSLGSSLLVVGAITVTRTAVYMANDYVWNKITRQKPAVRWPVGFGEPVEP